MSDVTLEARMYNLITAVHLAVEYRDRNKMPRMDGNAIVLIHSCALDYHAAGGKKYSLIHNEYDEPLLVVASTTEEY